MKSGATPQQMWTQVPTANKIASVIKSIQRGTAVIAGGQSTQAVTVSSVDTEKSLLSTLGDIFPTTWNGADGRGYLVLTNSTTITATRYGTGTVGGIAYTLTFSYELVEYF